jgi:uncharacterized Rossmann fold enzyme
VAKIDKSQYTKEQWHKIREERRQQKRLALINNSLSASDILKNHNKDKVAFVLGNGTSRKTVRVEELSLIGKTYGCNALYRSFSPDYLVAVDVKMIIEINSAGYQHKNTVWTNPNKSFSGLKNLNFFQPSKGWSSGPTALWLAAEHGYETVFVLGFDYRGLNNGKTLNNLYADTRNYKKSTDSATFFGNWMRQTTNVVKEHPNTKFIRVIQPDNYIPEELNKFDNVEHIFVEDFKKMFNLS